MRRLAIVGFLLVASPVFATTGAHRHGVEVGPCQPFDTRSVTMCDNFAEEDMCVRENRADRMANLGWSFGSCLRAPNIVVCCINNSPVFGEYMTQEDDLCSNCNDPFYTGNCLADYYVSGDGKACIPVDFVPTPPL